VNQLIVIPTHQDDYFLKRPTEVFTIRRNYIDLSYPLGDDRVLGTLYIDIDIKAIDDIFSHLGLYNYNGIQILDATNHLIYTNGVIPQNSIEITELCGSSGWRVIINVDYERATQNIINLVWLIYIIVVVVLLVLLALSIVYSNVFTRPIRNILRGMKQVEDGNFSIKLNVKGQDEIKLLADGFMEMTVKLEKYIQTVFLSKLRLKEAELSTLRARIKPHFIYNSLEIIRMNAIAHDDESTAGLTFHLAEFMRTLIEPGNNEVPLSQELNLLRSYLTFIDICYENRITWKIRVEDELSEAQVLSLMIQPIVENAIIHGIQPLGKGHIDINASREKDDLSIIIIDDGVGMSEGIKEKLTAQLQTVSYDVEANQDGDSIGLKNVHDRLRYTYGNSYGVSINSSPGKGTSITMLLPLRLPEKRNEDV
jgi:two-component system sensor histidine kinase YesM